MKVRVVVIGQGAEVFDDVTKAYVKDGLYCIEKTANQIIKFNISHIFQIVEDKP